MSASSDDTFAHTTKTKDGELRTSVVHGRIHETFRRSDCRIPVTFAMEAAEAVQHHRRALEIALLQQSENAARSGEA